MKHGVYGLTMALLSGHTIAASIDVAIDVGHSKARPGAIAASGATEFSLNRALALRVDASLRSMNLSTQMIGVNGDADRLADRTSSATRASLFVSLHHDSIKQEWLQRAQEFSGYSIFVSRRNIAPQKSLACAKKIALQMQASGFTPSHYHALEVPGEGRPFADMELGIHWFDDLIVLKTASQPAVLIEAGVIVNPDDEALVSSTEGRSILASAIGTGIRACFK